MMLLCDLCACCQVDSRPCVVTTDCQAQSSVLSSSPLCLRAKNPSWQKTKTNNDKTLNLWSAPHPPTQYLPQYEDDQGQQQQASDDATDQDPQRDGNRSALQHFKHRLPARKEALNKPEALRANQNVAMAVMAAAVPPPSRPFPLPE